MKTSWWKILGYLFSASLTVLLIACGGGGGDGGGGAEELSYNGITTQAQITDQNASDLAMGTWLAGESGSQIDIFGAVQSESEPNNKSFALLSVSSIFEEMAAKIAVFPERTEPYVGAVQTIDDLITGSCNRDSTMEGGATIHGSADDATGSFTASVNFQNYCDAGVILNGATTLSGIINLTTEEPINFTFLFSSLTLEESGEIITLNGSLGADYSVSPILMTMSFVIEDSTNTTFWFRNAELQVIGGADYVEISAMTGRYYHPSYGYVDISVGDPIHINDYESWPSSGSFILVGEGNTRARLTFVSSTTFQIDADTTGNGLYDYNSGVENW